MHPSDPARAASSAPAAASSWWDARWRGQPSRLEVWYATFTDRDSGTGVWLHGELVAPPGGGDPERHGWAALFPRDGAPVWHRTVRTVGAPTGDPAVFECDGLRLGPEGSTGHAGELSWDLRWDATGQRPLATFHRRLWERELLPAAQVVPAPDLAVSGTIDRGDQRVELAGAHGQVARIYGHGNAERWAWLHADLGGGELLELVTAVSTRPGLKRLPPITFLRFRLDGRDWPTSVAPAFRLTARLGLPSWRVAGRIGRSRVRIEVDQPQDRNVTVGYTDPDGRTATCTNTERADLRVELVDPDGRTRRWELEGTAHAEVGTRP